MPEQWLIDPTAENTGTQLDISTDPYAVVEFSSPAPPLETSMAGTIDTEGDLIAARRHQNRQVSFTVEVVGTSQANLDASVATLEAKVAELALEGGTFRRVRSDGTFRTLDVLAADQYDKAFDVTYFLGNLARCTVNLIARPYARGAEVQIGTTYSETTLPALTFTASGVAGDIPALGRLRITDAQAQPQAGLWWGMESTYLDPSTSLLFQAESMTLGSGTTAAAEGGTSGGSKIQNTTLSSGAYTVMATFTGANVGSFRVLARAKSAAGSSLKLYWSFTGSTQATSNAATVVPAGGGGLYTIADLGVINLPPNAYGAQQFTAQLAAAGSDMHIDYVWLLPVERSGEVQGDTNGIALNASRSFEVKHNGAWRQGDATHWAPANPYEGDYLLIPPAGSIGRQARFTLKTRRTSSFTYEDTFIDDVSAQLFYTPRYLSMF